MWSRRCRSHGYDLKRRRARPYSPGALCSQVGPRRPERRSHQTRPATHKFDFQDAKAWHLPRSSLKCLAQSLSCESQMNWFHWALLSALFAGLTAVLAKAGVKGIDSNLATAIRTVVILVFAWSIALTRGFDTLSRATNRTWLFLILSGLATGASWLCYFRALQLGEASKVAPVDKLSVVVAMVLAALFLGEHLTWRHGVGAGLIVAGTVIIAKI